MIYSEDLQSKTKEKVCIDCGSSINVVEYSNPDYPWDNAIPICGDCAALDMYYCDIRCYVSQAERIEA